jgi:hypothetical protein
VALSSSENYYNQQHDELVSAPPAPLRRRNAGCSSPKLSRAAAAARHRPLSARTATTLLSRLEE